MGGWCRWVAGVLYSKPGHCVSPLRPHYNWHEHKCPNVEVVLHAGGLNRFGEPHAGSLRTQELKAAVTTEGQLMSVAWQVEGVPSALAVLATHGKSIGVAGGKVSGSLIDNAMAGF